MGKTEFLRNVRNSLSVKSLIFNVGPKTNEKMCMQNTRAHNTHLYNGCHVGTASLDHCQQPKNLNDVNDVIHLHFRKIYIQQHVTTKGANLLK